MRLHRCHLRSLDCLFSGVTWFQPAKIFSFKLPLAVNTISALPAASCFFSSPFLFALSATSKCALRLDPHIFVKVSQLWQKPFPSGAPCFQQSSHVGRRGCGLLCFILEANEGAFCQDSSLMRLKEKTCHGDDKPP